MNSIPQTQKNTIYSLAKKNTHFCLSYYFWYTYCIWNEGTKHRTKQKKHNAKKIINHINAKKKQTERNKIQQNKGHHQNNNRKISSINYFF